MSFVPLVLFFFSSSPVKLSLLRSFLTFVLVPFWKAHGKEESCEHVSVNTAS